MVHAIEAYASVSANNNPLSRMLATQALTLMGSAVLTAAQDGGNIEGPLGDDAGLDAGGAGLR